MYTIHHRCFSSRSFAHQFTMNSLFIEFNCLCSSNFGVFWAHRIIVFFFFSYKITFTMLLCFPASLHNTLTLPRLLCQRCGECWLDTSAWLNIIPELMLSCLSHRAGYYTKLTKHEAEKCAVTLLFSSQMGPILSYLPPNSCGMPGTWKKERTWRELLGV